MIGLDPAWHQMIPSARRCQRDRLANALFVCASIEDPPEELRGMADEVVVHLPWGRLLSGVVRGVPDVCRGLRFLARSGGSLRVVVGADIWCPPVPKEVVGLPPLTPDYVDCTLTSRLADHGWKVIDCQLSSTVDVASSWARRLAAGRAEPSFVELRAEAVPPGQEIRL